MEINQNNKKGDNHINFIVYGSFENHEKKVKSFKNSDQIRKDYKRDQMIKIGSIIFGILNFLLSPIYGYFIIKLITKN